MSGSGFLSVQYFPFYGVTPAIKENLGSARESLENAIANLDLMLELIAKAEENFRSA